ncbi:hypothetical protein BDW74DRAFT_63740 [Aspergillus multicolor]|uniref:putative AT DNA binding protein n=1 Tax=Aspergillus multicolor TaxID=41759 RepID=UPI003CCD9CC7
MSHSRERPWTEEEKNVLLTEILKKGGVPSRELIHMIKALNIHPSWADIPLPSGRSLNSCQSAFNEMCHELAPPINPGAGPLHPQHPTAPQQPMPLPHPTSSVGKRPLYSTDNPMRAHRPIQPRPSAGPASYTSESGASTVLSPGTGEVPSTGEPPRKRGRPTKQESERRKAEAERRGAPFQPPSRRGSQKVKLPATPTSPSIIQAGGPAYTIQPSSRSSLIPPAGMHYGQPPSVPMPMSGASDDERMRIMPNQIGSVSRELPPLPQDTRQTFPALQFSHRESIPRIQTTDRPFQPPAPERLPFTDSSQRSLVHPSPQQPNEPRTLDLQVPLTAAEKRTQ